MAHMWQEQTSQDHAKILLTQPYAISAGIESHQLVDFNLRLVLPFTVWKLWTAH